MVQWCVVYEKIRKCQSNLFFGRLRVLKWCHNCFQSPVFGFAVLYPTGSEIWRFWNIKAWGRKIAYRKIYFAILISTLGRFNRANKKSCHIHIRASAWETGADLEIKVSRFCSKSVHKVVMWTYIICQSFSFNDLFPVEFWISVPQGSSKADFQLNFGHFSISLLATYN